MDIAKLTGLIGAEITNANLGDPSDLASIHSAFADHSVLVIRDQYIQPEDLIAFAQSFGQINVNRFFKAHPGHPQIALVVKEPDQTGAIGEVWHTDHAYDQIPALGSILHGLEIPPYGGDTVFVSMGAAYDALSDKMKQLLTGLTAHHASQHVFGANAKPGTSFPVAHQPMVIKHPLSGRSCLFVNPQFTTHIDGMNANESDAILKMLYAHCIDRPEFHCRVRWQPGTITLWDNRATWHKAINDYHGHRRYMHRITVEGVALTPA